ncbi:MAG: DUF6090 family protein [Pseudomonadota bacterium]
MLLRRITQHVRQQNWFAVGVDFIIVVVGVFIGIQVSNWNDAQKEKAEEQQTLTQLAAEFQEIEVALQNQIQIRQGWASDLEKLIATLETPGEPATEAEIKAGLSAAMATGRMPPRSATYVQLTTGGKLSSLSNRELQQALIRYDARLSRDAFIHEALIDLATAEVSSNPYVDRDVTFRANIRAAVDSVDDSEAINALIKSYDLDGLVAFEARYETMYELQMLLATTEQHQLSLAENILALIPDNLNE